MKESVGTDGRAEPDRRPVALWLFGMCFMIWVMVMLGGITRLSGSGLSIMDWQPVTGMLPPLSHREWERLFALYQQIPQYRLLHEGFGLDGFKRIFWMEWLHRFWGRLVGIAFLGPLVWFAWRGLIGWRLLPRLIALFVLGGLQGAVGWVMVASGFVPDSTAVSPPLLVAHLGMALLLYSAILWTALDLWEGAGSVRTGGARALRVLAPAACLAVACTILAGGFVAGTHAGLVYNEFPLMGGELVPPDYAALPFPRNLFQNLAAVQFDHRALATASLALCAAAGGLAWRRGPRRRGALLLGAVGAQYALGVATLLWVVPLPLAAAHQAMAIVALSAALALWHGARVERRRT